MIKWGRPNEGGTAITGYDVRLPAMTPADVDSWNQLPTHLPANKTSYVITAPDQRRDLPRGGQGEKPPGQFPLVGPQCPGAPVAVPSAPMSLSVEGSESRIVVSWDAPASSGDHPIDRYNWDVEDVASNGRDMLWNLWFTTIPHDGYADVLPSKGRRHHHQCRFRWQRVPGSNRVGEQRQR